MSLEDPRRVLQSIHEALNKRDVDKAASFFADDVVSVGPDGTFKGKAEVKRHFEWMLHQALEFKLTEVGIYAEGKWLHTNMS